MKIILSNGVELNPIMVTGGLKTVHGASRDVLNFIFPKEAGMEALDTAFTEAACANINIVGDDGSEAIHKGYTVRAGLSKAAVKVTEATTDTDAVYEDRITVSMGQRTYAETRMQEMEDALELILSGATEEV